MTRRPWLLVALLVVTACATFDDNTPVCVPETAAACFCATGLPGERVCAANGLAYGDCACLPDAGTDGAADASAVDAAVTPDAGTADALDAAPGPP